MIPLEKLARIRRYLVKGYTLSEIAQRTKLSAADLDLVLWYSLDVRAELDPSPQAQSVAA